MSNVRLSILLATIALNGLFLLQACSSHKPSITSAAPFTSTEEFINVSKQSSQQAQAAETRQEKINWSEHGISVAEQCLMRYPEEPGCYYYRAINTGLYYEARVIGYQKGIKQIIADCEDVIKFDPKYDHGGAYRILGQVYTKLPQTVGRPDSVSRDLDKAENYLKRAVRIDPDYPENQIFMAETLLAKDKNKEALEALLTAKEQTPSWRHDYSYTFWQTSLEGLEKKLKIANK
ncbi:MAG: tetratricopeptide repeat protein [Pseudomonadota bacterium]